MRSFLVRLAWKVTFTSALGDFNAHVCLYLSELARMDKKELEEIKGSKKALSPISLLLYMHDLK